MSDSERPKPLPVRPPQSATSGETVPEATPADPSPPEQLETAQTDVPEEVEFTWEGRPWVARVLGRSGRAEARSAPLMLVEFRDSSGGDPATVREGMVAGRRLADVPDEELGKTLARAKAPPTLGQKRPFFEDSDPTRRSGPPSEY